MRSCSSFKLLEKVLPSRSLFTDTWRGQSNGSASIALWHTLKQMYGDAVASEVAEERPVETQAAVVSLADKTVSAIRNKNSDFLSMIVDPRGISIGFDVQKKSAARFRKELSDKTGAYCVIFGGCPIHNGESSQTSPSVREIVMAQPVTTSLQPVEGEPEETGVAIKRTKNPSEVPS